MSDRPGNKYDCAAAMKRLSEGDQTALAVLYDLLGKPMYALAYTILKNPADAEDALQDAFLKILRGASGYRDDGNARAWAMSVARNSAIDLLRRRQKETAEDGEVLDSLSREGDFAESYAEADKMNRLLAILDGTDRDIVVLKAVDGFKFREIAGIVGITAEAARKRYSRAIKKLRAAY